MLELTDNFPVGAYFFYRDPVDNGPRFSFLSNRLLEMLDLAREEAEADPMNIYKRMHPDDLAPFIEVSLEAARLKAPFCNESRYIVRGETKWYRLESTPRQLPDGLTVWDGAVIDVTERRLAEERERQNEARQRVDLERKLRASLPPRPPRTKSTNPSAASCLPPGSCWITRWDRPEVTRNSPASSGNSPTRRRASFRPSKK